jgi:hypothetical protein
MKLLEFFNLTESQKAYKILFETYEYEFPLEKVTKPSAYYLLKVIHEELNKIRHSNTFYESHTNDTYLECLMIEKLLVSLINENTFLFEAKSSVDLNDLTITKGGKKYVYTGEKWEEVNPTKQKPASPSVEQELQKKYKRPKKGDTKENNGKTYTHNGSRWLEDTSVEVPENVQQELFDEAEKLHPQDVEFLRTLEAIRAEHADLSKKSLPHMVGSVLGAFMAGLKGEALSSEAGAVKFKSYDDEFKQLGKTLDNNQNFLKTQVEKHFSQYNKKDMYNLLYRVSALAKNDEKNDIPFNERKIEKLASSVPNNPFAEIPVEEREEVIGYLAALYNHTRTEEPSENKHKYKYRY